MNSIWNKNIEAFKKRFPQLCEIYKDLVNSISKNTAREKFFSNNVSEIENEIWKISLAKNGDVTATENGIRLHSSYNPSREAEQAVSSAAVNCDSPFGIFCGFGLGYTVTEFATKYPDAAILVIEPDPLHFFSALEFIDWTDVFKAEKCIVALGCPLDQIIPLSESFGISLDKATVFFNPAFVKHAEDYFISVKKLINRNFNKINLNENTKRKFGKLWERNARFNLKWAEKFDGVNIYKNKFAGEKFLLIAAGPSLEKKLPELKTLHEKMITVCVDTALKAVLRAGVEPDFIVLTDPQFWAYMHIAGLKSPSSVLIADAVSYPAVFRFQCKKIVISSSPFPLPDVYKNVFASKGDLGSGGSVATVAWNFCEFSGAKEIYTVGLDLSFPKKQTHIKGSSFEQNVHTVSKKINSSEKRTSDLLFGADVTKASDYNGNEVLTDSRMKMFAWWFESRIASCPHVKTYTLCPESMVIPGIVYLPRDAETSSV